MTVRLLIVFACALAVGAVACAAPQWKQDLAAEVEAARERWSDASAREVTYTVGVTECGGCEASALTEVVAIDWRDGRASTTGPADAEGHAPAELFRLAEGAIEHATDEDDVALAFDDTTGLPTRIESTWDAADDGDFAYVIEVTSVE